MKRTRLLLLACMLFLPSRAQDTHTFTDLNWMLQMPQSPVFQVLDTESSLGPYATRPRTITLEDLVHFHGHPCDGLVLAACALHLAFDKLYPAGVVDRTDTGIITNNSPCFGDVGAYLTGGRIRFGTQKIDPTMGNEFIVHRFSTGQTVRVTLKPGLFPKELSRLEGIIKNGHATLSQVRHCQEIQLDWIRRVLSRPSADLFDVSSLPGLVWQPDRYEHAGARGDVRMKTIAGPAGCLTTNATGQSIPSEKKTKNPKQED